MTDDTTDLVRGIESHANQISRYWDRLADPDAVHERSVLIPEEILPELQRAVEETLKPAAEAEVAKAVAGIIVGIQIPTDRIENREAYFRLMRHTLSSEGFPADVINEAARQAMRVRRITPATADLIDTATRLVEERRRRLLTIGRMQAEHSRRRRAIAELEESAEAERKRKAELAARREAHLECLRDLEARAREHFGDDEGPRPGDVLLADALSAHLVFRAGRRVSWQTALSGGERWAAKYCRQVALAARIKRALEQGKVSFDEAATTAKLISADETSARRLVDDLQSREIVNSGHAPGEAFLRALWKIARGCGLDTPMLPVDAAAAAIDNLNHLEGLGKLADTRAILDRQVQEEWAQRRRHAPTDEPG